MGMTYKEGKTQDSRKGYREQRILKKWKYEQP